MNTPEYQRSILHLPFGQLDLHHFPGEGHLFGQLVRGYCSAPELMRTLEKAGYTSGFSNESVDFIAGGSMELLPLASAYFSTRPPVVDDVFISRRAQSLQSCMDLASDLAAELQLYRVMKGQVLKRVLSPQSTVLIFPDGKEELISEDSAFDIAFFVGNHTSLNHANNEIIAAEEGIAHRTVSGIVHVYPEKTVSGIGVSHRNIDFQYAVHVKNDVNSGSWLDLPSSLSVDGMIVSSTIYTGGDILCKAGVSNHKESERIYLEIGGNLRTTFVHDYKIWVGDSAYVLNRISGSNLQVRENLITSQISGSVVKVGQKLVADEITDESEIYLGSMFVDNPEVDKRKRNFRLHEQRMANIRTSLNQLQFQIDKTRDRFQILKGKAGTSPGQLKSFYRGIEDYTQQYAKYIEELRQVGDSLIEERGVLDFYDSLTRQNDSPELIVRGHITPGVKFVGPRNDFQVWKALESVRISVNEVSGYLEINPITEQEL